VLQAQIFEADKSAIELLTANGFALVRQWLHLEMNLTQPPPAPVWPEGFVPRLLERARDWNAVFVALEEAFADHWGVVPPQTTSPPEAEEDEDDDDEIDLYSNTRGLCFAAMHGQEVVGSALCNARTVEWADTGKLGSLSVRRPFRWRGLARALTLTALGQFYQRGIRRVITDTDNQNFTGSYNLYFSLGMRPYRYENVYEKELRAGREWRILKPEDAPMNA
jgi:ribosomal protein S18 acetylase RimI-like enzyme